MRATQLIGGGEDPHYSHSIFRSSTHDIGAVL
jgi:hypothetical protein